MPLEDEIAEEQHANANVLRLHAPLHDEAIAFEKRLKGWSHIKKRAFIERDWPLLKRFASGRRR